MTPAEETKARAASQALSVACHGVAVLLHNAAHAAVPDAPACPQLVVLASFDGVAGEKAAVGMCAKGDPARLVALLEEGLAMARRLLTEQRQQPPGVAYDFNPPIPGPTVH